MPLTSSPATLPARRRRISRWLAALLAVALLPGLAFADHGKDRKESLFLFTGKAQEGVELRRFYWIPESVVASYGDLIPALEAYLGMDDELPPPEEGPGTDALCDQLLVEYWALAGTIGQLQAAIVQSSDVAVYDSAGQPTGAYYVLMARLEAIAREQARASYVLETMMALGCESLPTQPL